VKGFHAEEGLELRSPPAFLGNDQKVRIPQFGQIIPFYAESGVFEPFLYFAGVHVMNPFAVYYAVVYAVHEIAVFAIAVDIFNHNEFTRGNPTFQAIPKRRVKVMKDIAHPKQVARRFVKTGQNICKEHDLALIGLALFCAVPYVASQNLSVKSFREPFAPIQRTGTKVDNSLHLAVQFGFTPFFYFAGWKNELSAIVMEGIQ
jgi:hypothetical protein